METFTDSSWVNWTNETVSPKNSTNQEDIDASVYSIAIPAIWSLLFITGTLGNILVIIVTVRSKGTLTPTNCFIVNLAITDLAFLIVVIPFTAAVYSMDHWVFGHLMCRFVLYMVYVTLFSTCLTLTVMTIDRYNVILRPLRSIHKRTTRKALITSCMIWITSLTMAAPGAIFVNTDMRSCAEFFPSEYWGIICYIYYIVVSYIVPLAVIVYCYIKIMRHLWRRENKDLDAALAQTNRLEQRKRITKMVAVVTVLFATCWLPVHCLNLYFKIQPDFPRSVHLYNFKIFSHTLSYANSCVNPFVYVIMGKKFRETLARLCVRLPDEMETNYSSVRKDTSNSENNFRKISDGGDC